MPPPRSTLAIAAIVGGCMIAEKPESSVQAPSGIVSSRLKPAPSGSVGEQKAASGLRPSISAISAFNVAYQSPADAIILISDGLPNPAFNNNLGPSSLVRNITVANAKPVEIHAVTVGDYFKYRGTVEFMESLARANAGSFLALAQ